MGNQITKNNQKKPDFDFNPKSVNLEIPYRSSLHNIYRIEQPIWRETSSYSITKAVHLKTKKAIVMKKMRINPGNRILFTKEIYMLNRLDHFNIVQLYEYFQTKTHFYIIYIYFDAPSLTDYYIKNDDKISEAEVKKIIKEILSTLNYIHSNNVILRNFDPSNVLYNGESILIIGFNAAMPVKRSIASGRARVKFQKSRTSPFYKAPEVVKKNYDTRADVWVVGVLLHIFLTGKLPFNAANQQDLFDRICNKDFDDSVLTKQNHDETVIELIRLMLVKDPDRRAKIPDLLENPWFELKEGDYDKRLSKEVLKNIKQVNTKKNLIDKLMVFSTDKVFLDKEMNDLQKLFNQIDVNKDGVVTKDELKEALEYINLIISDKQIDTIFRKYDDNKSGTLEFHEFAAAFIDRKRITEKGKLNELYEYINVENKEKITLTDFENKIFYKLNNKEKKLFLRAAGHDKALNKEEFANFITTFIEERR